MEMLNYLTDTYITYWNTKKCIFVQERGFNTVTLFDFCMLTCACLTLRRAWISLTHCS